MACLLLFIGDSALAVRRDGDKAARTAKRSPGADFNKTPTSQTQNQ